MVMAHIGNIQRTGVHDTSSKDTSPNTTISLQRQLGYYDSLSNATLSLLLFYLRHLVKKIKADGQRVVVSCNMFGRSIAELRPLC